METRNSTISKPLADEKTYFYASAIAGSISHVISYPISTMVSRLQVSTEKINTINHLVQIIFPKLEQAGYLPRIQSLNNGFLLGGLYRVSRRTVRFGAQPLVADQFQRYLGSQLKNYFNEDESKVFVDCLGGATVAAGHVLAFAPLDTIRTKRQNGNKLPLRNLIQQEGFHLYNGSSITAGLAKHVPKALALFGVSSSILNKFKNSNGDESDITLKQHIVSAFGGATASVIFSNPQSVIKARIQNLSGKDIGKVSTFSLFKKTVQEEGFSALYKGVPFRIFLSIPEKVLPLALAGYLINAWKKQEEKTLSRPSKTI